MRILFATAAYPGPTDPARAPALAALARALAARRHEVEVLCPRGHAADPPEEGAPPLAVRRFEIGAPGRTLKSYGARPPALLLARYAGAAILALRAAARRADVIYAHWAVPMGFLAAAAAARGGRGRGRPLVLHVHGSDMNEYARNSRIYGRLAAYAVRRARVVLAVSEELAEAARRAGAREARVVPMGVDTGVFAPGGRSGTGTGTGTKTAIFVGDVSEEKGARDFVEAVRAMPEWSGIVVGEGPLRKELEGRAEGRVRFAGRVPHEAVAEELAAADVFCLPSRSEGAPAAVMEALACGVPVVATRVGAIPALVEEGRTGFFVGPAEAADPAAHGAALARAAALPPFERPATVLAVETCAERVERALAEAAAP